MDAVTLSKSWSLRLMGANWDPLRSPLWFTVLFIHHVQGACLQNKGSSTSNNTGWLNGWISWCLIILLMEDVCICGWLCMWVCACVHGVCVFVHACVCGVCSCLPVCVDLNVCVSCPPCRCPWLTTESPVHWTSDKPAGDTHSEGGREGERPKIVTEIKKKVMFVGTHY